MSNIKINKIQLSNFRFFVDDEKNNTFEPNKNGMLIYGENGSGKSSLFKAFEFLASDEILENKFEENKNIFNKNSDAYLEFKFDNNEEIIIDKDHLKVNNDYPYVNALSVFRPVLDYKHLLKVHYQTDKKKDEINIYEMLQELFKDFPLDTGGVLSSINSPKEYFEKLGEIINNNFLNDINKYLKIFGDRFEIEKFHFDMSFLDDGKVEFIVNLIIDYKNVNDSLPKYHLFLNEARLTALAISIYFAIIKNISDKLANNSLKILVLDDLLISLDMSNRVNLIKLLEKHFKEFQIFFFTHEKGLFDLFKEKMNLKPYEIYVSKKDDYEVPFIKESNSLLEQAIQQKNACNYGCSANLLRQSTEELICKFLPNGLIIGDRCKVVELDKLLNRAIKFEDTKIEDKDEEIVEKLKKLKTFKRVLLNDASHYNDTDIYKVELEEAIEVLEKLREKI